MKRLIISLAITILCISAFSQNYSYIPAIKSGAALYQYGEITSPVGADTTASFEGYFGKPYTIFVDFRTLDANNSQLDVGVRGLNMDTVFLSLDTTNFPVTVDTAIFDDKVIVVKSNSCYSPEVILKYIKGSASAGLKFPYQVFTEK